VTAAAVSVLLLVGGLVPVPFERRPAFSSVGPDKLLHLLGHGAFSVALADALAADGRGDGESAVVAAATSTAYSFAIGRLQRRVPGRVPERADVVAGVVGSVLAVVWWAIRGDDRPAFRGRTERR
jgi:VanZ family protein